MTPALFELHAGSSNKRPPEYIYLENGSTLRDVMNTCSNVPLDTLEEAVQKVLGGFTMKKSTFCFNCRGLKFTCLIYHPLLMCLHAYSRQVNK